MLTVPQEYHTYSSAPERRTDLVVRLAPLGWPTNINAHGTAHSLCLPIQWDKAPPYRLYASGEYNRTPLDGRALVNGWTGQVYGYLSNALSDKDGLFSADAVKLSCTRNGAPASVMTICFDPAANEYAVDFDVTIDGASSTETYHQEWHIRNNDQPIVYITGIHAAYDTVTVTVSEWSHPFHRARIREIANGVLFEATGDSLYSCSMIAESDPTNQSIPTGECNLTYPDPQGMFDPANPSGVSSSVQTNQTVTVWIGVSDGQHKPAYAKIGTYYCPKATSKGGTGELQAVDVFGYVQSLGKMNVRLLEYLNDRNLADFVRSLGASPGIPATDFTGSAPTAFAEDTSRMEALRYVSQYLRKMLYADPDGNARLIGMSRTPVATIPLDQSYDYPALEAREEIGGIDYTWHHYDGSGEEVLAAENTVISVKGASMTYTATTTEPVAYTRYEIVHEYASDFVVSIVETGSRKIKYRVKTDATFTDPNEYYVTVKLYGKKIVERTSTGNSETEGAVNKDLNRLSVDNPIPHSDGDIFGQVAWSWYLRSAYGKADITCNWRGDASLQVGDPVTVEGKYGPIDGVIIKQEIDYDGALNMRTTVRQLDRVINLGGWELMHVKTGWTPRDYPDLYVTDDGETFDLVQGGQANNNNALAFNRILQNCKTVADVYNKIFGTAWGYGFTPFTVASIYSATNLQLIEDRCGELAKAFGLEYTGKIWAAGDVVDYRDLNRWEAPFEFLQRYDGKTADDFGIIRCGTILCGGAPGDYRYHFCGDFYCGDDVAKFE